MNNDVIAAILTAGILVQKSVTEPASVVRRFRAILAELERPAEAEAAKPEPKPNYNRNNSGYSAPKALKAIDPLTM